MKQFTIKEKIDIILKYYQTKLTNIDNIYSVQILVEDINSTDLTPIIFMSKLAKLVPNFNQFDIRYIFIYDSKFRSYFDVRIEYFNLDKLSPKVETNTQQNNTKYY